MKIGDFPFESVRLECTRCGRRGRCAKARLVERFGAGATSPDVRMALVQCERGKSFGDPCGARFTGLVKRP